MEQEVIFFNLNHESTVQVEDLTRLDASKTQVSPDEGEITLVRVSPDNGTNWYDITNSDSDRWYLDWAFATEGEKSVVLEITTDNSAAQTKVFVIDALSVQDDCLFSTDEDLVKYEPEIKCYIRRGRCSFLDVHRCSQNIIMEWLQRQIEISTDPSCVARKLECKDLYCKEEVRSWSVYQALVLIFEGLSNQVDDVFSQKAARYSELMYRARSRAEITVDFNQDGVADNRESLRSSRIVRR